MRDLRAAFVEILQEINRFIAAQDFVGLNTRLETIDIVETSPECLVAWLRYSGPAKSQLPAWTELVSRVYEKYKDEPGDVAHTVRLFGKFPPKAVESLCPFCEHYEVNKVFEKDTIVCQACERPFELYEDGRVEPSMLYEAVGTVNFRNHRGEFYTGNGPSMKTREDETN